jgi:GABA(A) receptor-associated protein
MDTVTFKQSKEFHLRINESKKILAAHPDRVPIIVEPALNCTLDILDKKKYLIPKGVSVGQFAYVIRSRINLKPEEAIFLFIRNVLPPTSASMVDIYEEHKDADGFLYVTYAGENTFGT